jgi:hypothetical protein
MNIGGIQWYIHKTKDMCRRLVAHSPSPFLPFIFDPPVEIAFQYIKALDIDTEMADLAIICMDRQLQDPNIPKHCSAIEASHDH